MQDNRCHKLGEELTWRVPYPQHRLTGREGEVRSVRARKSFASQLYRGLLQSFVRQYAGVPRIDPAETVPDELDDLPQVEVAE